MRSRMFINIFRQYTIYLHIEIQLYFWHALNEMSRIVGNIRQKTRF